MLDLMGALPLGFLPGSRHLPCLPCQGPGEFSVGPIALQFPHALSGWCQRPRAAGAGAGVQDTCGQHDPDLKPP